MKRWRRPLIPWLLLVASAIPSAQATAKNPLDKELQNRQRNEGLCLMTVQNGAVQRLDFTSHKFVDVYKLPNEVCGDLYYALDWPRQLLAGHSSGRLFIMDLQTRKIKWIESPAPWLGALSFSHGADQLAFVGAASEDLEEGCRLWTLERSTGICKLLYEPNVGSLYSCPHWSADDSQVAIDTVRWVPIEPAHGWLAILSCGQDSGTKVSQRDVAIVDVRQRQVMTTMKEAVSPSWDPNAGEVTFWNDGLYKRVAFQTKSLPKPVVDGLGSPLVYSPNGKYGAYTRGWWADINIKGFTWAELMVVRLADGKRVRVYGPYEMQGTKTRQFTWAYFKPRVRAALP
jgi:hypothetical protein